ncbi:MAG: GspH/FimT family pseudopilin [Nitrosomonas sp.]|nr:MAG: GspH/FimT family pseudopilin [Nitrosomonas sp.]
MCNYSDFRGFTLIELLIAMSILTIMLAVGVPSLSQFTLSSRLNSYSNALMQHLSLARSEAIKRNTRVAICKSSDNTTCASSGDWSQGWIVFVDSDNNANAGSAEPIITTMPPLAVGYSFSGNSNVSNYISFDEQGIPKLTSGGFQSGTITLCPAKPAPSGIGRDIILSSSGRSRIAKIDGCL